MKQIAVQLRLEEYLYAHLDEGRTFILHGEKSGVVIVISTNTPAGWNATRAAMKRVEGIYEQETGTDAGRSEVLEQLETGVRAQGLESIQQADPARA